MHSDCVDLRRIASVLAHAGLCVVVLFWATGACFGGECPVIRHAQPTEADTAFLNADYAKAVVLYKAALAKNPTETSSIAGLVRSLLRENMVLEAADALSAPTRSIPESALLIALRGELELRQGTPWKAVKSALAAYNQDPCNPRTILLLSRLEELNSQHATARKLLIKAHHIDPEDNDIRADWMKTLPLEQRISETESYLAAPRGESAGERSELQTNLAHLKAWAAEPRKPCTMASNTATAEFPMVPILSNSDRTIGFGVPVSVNKHAMRLAIDTSYNPRLPIDSFSGLLISHAAARHAHLEPIFNNDVAGTGPQGPREGFVGIADSIAVGDFVFNNCAVQVMEFNVANGADGVIGLEILSNYLVTLDYPSKKITLESLPARPSAMVATDGLYNRYAAPTMKDYTPFLRSGTDIILPSSINGRPPVLFVLDTAVEPSVASPAEGYQVMTGHPDPKFESRNVSSFRDSTYTIHNATITAAGVTLNEPTLYPFDTSRFTDDSGMEISGMIGLGSLARMTVHIDYRDGLLKFDYDPARKSPLAY